MTTVKIQGYFLPIHNSGWPDTPSKKINLLIDHEARDKITNVARFLTGSDEPKVPIKRKGSDILLTVAVSDVILCTNDGAAASLSNLLGLEIMMNIKVQKYALTSKYEKNAGTKIVGVSTKLMSASV